MISDLAARFRAIETLYSFLDRHDCGTQRFDEIDHAIDLALEPRRKVDRYFVRNVIRDAERVIRRRRRRQRLTLETDYFAAAASNGEQLSLADLLTDRVSPPDERAALDIVQHAIRSDGSHARGRQVFRSLVDGCTTRETADTVGVSPAYASILMRRMKDAVQMATNGVPA